MAAAVASSKPVQRTPHPHLSNITIAFTYTSFKATGRKFNSQHSSGSGQGGNVNISLPFADGIAYSIVPVPELRIYRVWDKPIGPHPLGMFEINLFTPGKCSYSY
jgi:hypothetical protein